MEPVFWLMQVKGLPVNKKFSKTIPTVVGITLLIHLLY